jgi:hypothetical protein
VDGPGLMLNTKEVGLVFESYMGDGWEEIFLTDVQFNAAASNQPAVDFCSLLTGAKCLE